MQKGERNFGQEGEPRTTIELISGGKVVNTLEIPFSADETEVLRSLQESRESLGVDAAIGSGTLRNLYARWPIPWGFGLKDRQQALEKIGAAAAVLSGAIAELESGSWSTVATSRKEVVEAILNDAIAKLRKFTETGA